MKLTKQKIVTLIEEVIAEMQPIYGLRLKHLLHNASPEYGFDITALRDTAKIKSAAIESARAGDEFPPEYVFRDAKVPKRLIDVARQAYIKAGGKKLPNGERF